MPFCLDNSYIYAFVKAIAEVNKLLTSPRLFFFSRHVLDPDPAFHIYTDLDPDPT